MFDDNKEINSKNGGWFWLSWTVELLILKVVTGENVGGWSEARARGLPVSVPSKHY